MFWDDGVSLINSANPNYHFIEFNYENVYIFFLFNFEKWNIYILILFKNKFNSVIKTQGSNVESLNFETIKIYGLDKNVNQVLINSKPTNNFAFDSVNKVNIIQIKFIKREYQIINSISLGLNRKRSRAKNRY